jgi:8-oxo-dGTP diphosphatase
MHHIVPYVLLILEKDNKILLVQRGANATFAPLLFSLVGGKIESDEAPSRAACREAYEELGINIKPEDLTFVHVFYRKGTENTLAAFIFKTASWTGEPFNKEPHLHEQIKWFEKDKLPEKIIPAHKQALLCIKNNTYYSEHGFDD